MKRSLLVALPGAAGLLAAVAWMAYPAEVPNVLKAPTPAKGEGIAPLIPRGQARATDPAQATIPVIEDGMTRLVRSAREREEAARIQGGRSRHRDRVSAAPSLDPRISRRLAGRLTKPQDDREWVEAFHGEGLAPPERVITSVAGKIMSPISREGIVNARVILLSFLPMAGEVYPAVTEVVTDGAGEFSAEVPLPPKHPANHPALGLVCAVSDGGIDRLLIQGAAIRDATPGRLNQLGIFWAPQHPFEVECDARAMPGPDLGVVCTGALDPSQWTVSCRSELLGLFPLEPLAGTSLLRGGWDRRDPPFVTLMQGSMAGPTLRCVLKGEVPENEPRCFQDIVFGREENGLVGWVADGGGRPVASATVTGIGGAQPVAAITREDGSFTLREAGLKSLMVQHDDFIAVERPLKPGDATILVTLARRKPVVRFTLRDRATDIPIDRVGVRLVEQGPKTADLELQAVEGVFTIKSEFLLASVILTLGGYFPRTVKDPVALQEQTGGRLDLYLNPGRRLALRPRDYASVRQTEKWIPDPDPGPGITTNWDDQWIEWRIDFGEAPEADQEGGVFDLLLGCTNNHGLVDHDYRFQVEVSVDGVKAGVLDIAADNLAVQTGRLTLGRLGGIHALRLLWLNDKWIPDQLDANIRYASLEFVERP